MELQNIRRNFENLSMKDPELVKEFHSRVTIIVNQTRALGENLKKQKIVKRS